MYKYGGKPSFDESSIYTQMSCQHVQKPGARDIIDPQEEKRGWRSVHFDQKIGAYIRKWVSDTGACWGIGGQNVHDETNANGKYSAD